MAPGAQVNCICGLQKWAVGGEVREPARIADASNDNGTKYSIIGHLQCSPITSHPHFNRGIPGIAHCRRTRGAKA